ncbi:MAG: hypothetical protein Q4A28_09605 [Brachymonas sp.]|nr:hypothetical protein [Brachymonas sp.]
MTAVGFLFGAWAFGCGWACRPAPDAKRQRKQRSRSKLCKEQAPPAMFFPSTAKQAEKSTLSPRQKPKSGAKMLQIARKILRM